MFFGTKYFFIVQTFFYNANIAIHNNSYINEYYEKKILLIIP